MLFRKNIFSYVIIAMVFTGCSYNGDFGYNVSINSSNTSQYSNQSSHLYSGFINKPLIRSVTALGLLIAAGGQNYTCPPVNITDISLGSDFGCSLDSDYQVKCWGTDSAGGLGKGTITEIGVIPGEMGNNLTAIDLGTNFYPIQISVGNSFVCALSNLSEIKCWGDNSMGQLGRGNTNNIGDQLGEMGNNLTAIDLGTNFYPIQISCGSQFVCAVSNTSKIKCWGDNLYGQLGKGNTEDIGDAPGEMGNNLTAIDLGVDFYPIQVTCNSDSTCALSNTSEIKCWGRNHQGQLGIGSTENIGDEPGEMGNNLTAVNLGDNFYPVQVLGSFRSSCAISNTSKIKCWGENSSGQLGIGSNKDIGDEPGEMGNNLTTINLGTNFYLDKVSIGGASVCALSNISEVKCWGNNFNGQLGQGNTEIIGNAPGEMGNNLTAIDLGTGFNSTIIAGGNGFFCAFSDQLELKCWGRNIEGQLGIGNTTGKYLSVGDAPNEMGNNLLLTNLGTQNCTLSPTDSPTNSPSDSPTNSPSLSPTNSPTNAPTFPSNSPTDSPTNSPTLPSSAPTFSPTDMPTQAPTNFWTKEAKFYTALGALGLIFLLLVIILLLVRLNIVLSDRKSGFIALWRYQDNNDIELI